MTQVQQMAMQTIRELESELDSIYIPYSSLKAKGYRQSTIDVLESEGFLFTAYVSDNVNLIPCVVRVSKELLDSHGIKKHWCDKLLWHWWQIDLSDGRSLRMQFNGYKKPGKRWIGSVLTMNGDQSSAGDTDIFGLIGTLKEISEPNSGK